MSTADNPLVLIYGESSNDTGALAELIPALLPESFSVSSRKLKSPVILSRAAGAKKRIAMSKLVAAVEKQERRQGKLVIVVAHRDCDAVEPAHIENAVQLETDLRNAGVQSPVAATPAWCIETWWMQFGKETSAIRRCWRTINYKGKSVGLIPHAKEHLTQALKPTGPAKNCPEYHESDSILIAQAINSEGAARHPNALLSGSLADFRSRLIAALNIPDTLLGE